MITRSLVGCLFRLEHPKRRTRWQTRLVIYFQVIASDIYTTRLSTTYIYNNNTLYYYDSPEFVYGEEEVVVTDGSSFYSHCYAKETKKFFLVWLAWWRREDLMRPWETTSLASSYSYCWLCVYVAFLVIINDWPVEVWRDRRLSPAAGVGTAVDGLKGLTSGPVCCGCSCLLLIPSSITALTALERWWDEPIDEAEHTTVSCCPLPKCSRVNLLMCNPTVVEASNTIVTALLPVLAPPDSSPVSTDDERQRVG